MTGAVGPCITAGGSCVEAALVGIRPGVHPRTAGDFGIYIKHCNGL